MRAQVLIGKTKLIEDALQGFLHFKPTVIGADCDLRPGPQVIHRRCRNSLQADMTFARQVCGERRYQRTFTDAQACTDRCGAEVLLGDKRSICPVEHWRNDDIRCS